VFFRGRKFLKKGAGRCAQGRAPPGLDGCQFLSGGETKSGKNQKTEPTISASSIEQPSTPASIRTTFQFRQKATLSRQSSPLKPKLPLWLSFCSEPNLSVQTTAMSFGHASQPGANWHFFDGDNEINS